MVKLSIIIVSQENNEEVLSTQHSLNSQSYQDFETLYVVCGENNFLTDAANNIKLELGTPLFKGFNGGIKAVKGEYCLFLRAGDCLAHDRVVEELFLNGLDTDIVYANTIIQGIDDNKEDFILTPDILRASDLLLNPFPYQGILFKRTLFSELHLFDDTLLFSSAHLLVIEALLAKQKTSKHIQLFVARCNHLHDDSTELSSNLPKVVPALYQDYIELGIFRTEAAQERMQVLRKLGKSILFKAIWNTRELLHKIGLYDAKATLKRKLYYRKIAKADQQRKKEVEQKIYLLPENYLQRNNNTSDIIVSLTSYGRRVTDSAPYAIYSLFTQKRLPNRIILFLDHDNWNEDNIPPLLKRLQKSGLEIMFCEDLRSYKKLIPSLKLFPDNVILTYDDDFYFHEDMIVQSLEAYEQSDKKTVICHWAFIAEKRNGAFIPYTQWKDDKLGNENSLFSPLGGDGALYPPRIFDEDILNPEIFMQLSPTADDIFFWVQEYRNGVKVKLIENSCKDKNVNVNSLDLLVQKGSTALYFENCVNGRNDEQLQQLLEYYKIQ